MELDPKKTAVLTLDFQKGIFDMFSGTETVTPYAEKALEFARNKKYQIIHIGVGFSEGYPELAANSRMASRVIPEKLFIKGSPSIDIINSIAKPDELIVYKQRHGAFSENHLHLILRSRGVENLILFGVSTSGVVLSTVRRAFDLDFNCFIIKEACFDIDPEVHRVLMEKIFPKQATVLSLEEFLCTT